MFIEYANSRQMCGRCTHKTGSKVRVCQFQQSGAGGGAHGPLWPELCWGRAGPTRLRGKARRLAVTMQTGAECRVTRADPSVIGPGAGVLPLSCSEIRPSALGTGLSTARKQTLFLPVRGKTLFAVEAEWSRLSLDHAVDGACLHTLQSTDRVQARIYGGHRRSGTGRAQSGAIARPPLRGWW